MTNIIKDKTSIEWIAIKEFCQNRLAELRAENDNELSETETATLRGMIKFAKEILSLDETEKKIEVTDTRYID